MTQLSFVPANKSKGQSRAAPPGTRVIVIHEYRARTHDGYYSIINEATDEIVYSVWYCDPSGQKMDAASREYAQQCVVDVIAKHEYRAKPWR